MTRWICAGCRAEYDERPPTCGLCLSHHGLLPLPARLGGRDVATAPRLRRGVVRAQDLRPSNRLADFGEPWASSWRIEEPHAVLLVGAPGSGKSTLAAQLAVSAARRRPVLFVAAEEGHGGTVVQRFARAGLDELSGHRLSVSDARTVAEMEEDLAASDARLVVVDSATEMRATAEWISATLAGRSWLVVAHANSRGSAYYGRDLEHAADMVVDVADGLATPRKNRWGGMASVRVWEEAA